MHYSTIVMREDPDTYHQHGMINKLFPDQRVLFHVDGKMIRVLSQQPIIHDKYKSKPITKDTFKVGEAYAFSTRMNPIKANIRNKNIQALHGVDAELFILKRFAQAGIKVTANTMMHEGALTIDKPANTITFNTYHVCGILEIMDLDKFWSTLTRGFIGRGKAFGYNMLNIIQ